MSLINDALKKRREAEQQLPPARGDLGLQPIDLNAGPAGAEGIVSRAKRFWLIAVIAVVVVNIGLVFWYAQKQAIKARARAAEVEAKAAQAAEAEAEEVRLAAAHAAAAAAASNAALARAEHERILSQRPGFHLQGIIFHPTRPSAIVNNRVVFVGDRVDGYSVTALTRTQVTLATDRDEVTLSLP